LGRVEIRASLLLSAKLRFWDEQCKGPNDEGARAGDQAGSGVLKL
jgi:hypothetical protein